MLNKRSNLPNFVQGMPSYESLAKEIWGASISKYKKCFVYAAADKLNDFMKMYFYDTFRIPKLYI